MGYMKHMGEVHPYAPFPIERLEAAVAEAAAETGSELLMFGAPTRFRSVQQPLCLCLISAFPPPPVFLAAEMCSLTFPPFSLEAFVPVHLSFLIADLAAFV